MTLLALYNGTPAQALPLTSRALAYGDGLFETIKVEGGRAQFLSFHLQRLRRDCVRLDIALDEAALRCEIAQLLTQQPSGVLKIIVAREAATRGYFAARGTPGSRLLQFFPQNFLHDDARARLGVAVRLCRQIGFGGAPASTQQAVSDWHGRQSESDRIQLPIPRSVAYVPNPSSVDEPILRRGTLMMRRKALSSSGLISRRRYAITPPCYKRSLDKTSTGGNYAAHWIRASAGIPASRRAQRRYRHRALHPYRVKRAGAKRRLS